MSIEGRPVFPTELTPLGPDLSVAKFGIYILYLSPQGAPLRTHTEDDTAGFWAATSFFYTVGAIGKQADIVRVFGVSLASVRRAVKVHLAHGLAGFYAPPELLKAPTAKPPTVASIRRSARATVREFKKQGWPPEPAPSPKRRPAILTLPILIKARELLDQGLKPAEVADQLGVQRRSMTSAVNGGLLSRQGREDSIPE